MSIDVPKEFVLEKGLETYSIKPRTPLGIITPEQLKAVAEVVEEFSIPHVKITAGQRLLLSGIRKEDAAAVKDRLGPMGEVCAHFVQACPGNTVCRYGLADSLALGERLEALLADMDLPAKVKAGISACPRNCGGSPVRDIGLSAKPKGWSLHLGGNAGIRPRIADMIAGNLNDDEVMQCIERFLQYYAEEARPKERTARFMDRAGVEAIQRIMADKVTQ